MPTTVPSIYSSAMLFDFEPFLSAIDPLQRYEIQPLTGGLVNVTVRATKVSGHSSGLFPAHGSLILKYAPPFVAAIGESAPFSQDRQLVEARALAHFNPPDGPLCDLRRSTSVTVPKLLYHHTEEHILVIEDLGPLVTLSEYISAIGNVKAASLLPWREPYRTLGARIGDFFGHLHSSESRAKVKTANSGTFENSLVKDLILQEAVIPIQKHLTRFNIPNASILFRRVLEDYQRANLPSEQRFVLGDFTPGAILLPTERGDGWQTLGVIDWEFSGLGRGPNGDMAQFLAHLHLLLMAAFGEDQRYHALESFISCICATYRMQSLTWLGDLSLRSPHPAAATSALESLQIFRSALILHGREMINNAAEQNCSGSGHNEGPHLIQEMVQKGAWYLERAGSDVEEMLDGANVNELFKEDHRIMLNLFGITD